MMLNRDISRKITGIADRFEKEKNFWLDKMAGNPIKTMFPCLHEKAGMNRQTEKGTTGDTVADVKIKETIEFAITGKLFADLMDLCKGNDYKLHIFLAALVVVLLYKYTGNKDIIIASPIYKQDVDTEFINTVLAFRSRIEDNGTFKEFLLQIRETIADATKNQNYPIEKLVEELNLESPGEDFPLFDVVVLLENLHEKKYIQHIKSNITFFFLKSEGLIKGTAVYNSLRYERFIVERIISHFINLFQHVLHNIDIKVVDVDVLSNAEKKQFLFDCNTTKVEYPQNVTIHQLFEEQVERMPDNIAVVGASMGVNDRFITSLGEKDDSPEMMEQHLAFKELNRKANQLAYFLVSKGVEPESIVAIMAERSVEMIIGILGILKAGGAYLPISPGLPITRKKFMLKDSSTGYLLLQEHLLDQNRDVMECLSQELVFSLGNPKIYVQKDHNAREKAFPNPQAVVGPGNPGYIIYTSGSTGRPKGVILEHRGIVNYVRWAAKKYVKNEKVTFPFYTSFSFDLTVTSIFTPLVTGNAIVVYSGSDKEFPVKRVMEEDRVDIVKLTPSHLRLIRNILKNELYPVKCKRIKRLIVGGENFDVQLADDIWRLFDGNIEIYNEYGPTETVVGSMIYRFDPRKDKGESVPIGIPIDNTQIYLLDENKKPVPFGVPVELFISGDGVARGYLNRPGLTAGKFLSNPFLSGENMYATGDLACRYPPSYKSGSIEFLGRSDQQVKIRGFRVELEEIENKIRNFNKVNRLKDTAKNASAEASVETLKKRNMTRCSKCLLPDKYPGIRLDGHGVCNFCREYEGYKDQVNKYFKEEEDFIRLVNEVKRSARGSGQYDCLLLFSGGKDSSYVLYRLIEMGLKVLTFTFDNGYISEAAFENIERITSKLKVNHIVGKSENMNNVFVESLRSSHNVCQGCWHALNTFAVKIAHTKGIPLVISGLSRGQIFEMRLEGLFRAGIFSENEIDEKLLIFRKAFHSKENKFSRILNVVLDEDAVESIRFVDFFRYISTPVRKIKEYLLEKGWVQPEDTGFCSSNCIINDVGIYVFLKNQGYHFYASPLSWDIRLGQLSRDVGLKEISFDMDFHNVEKILEEIGLHNDVSIKDAVVLDREEEKGNKYLCAYIVSEVDVSLFLSPLREYLAEELPDYMIPSRFVQVQEIPLTAIGKIDKKALLESEGTPLDMARDMTYVAPRDEKEKLMADVCKEIFSLGKIGVNDNFFNLGATSFSIIRLNSKLQTVFKKDIPVLTMFEYPTIASFLRYMEMEIPDLGNSQEEEDWVVSKKKGQDKFKRLRSKRIKSEEDGNG